MKRRSLMKGVGTATTALSAYGCSLFPAGKFRNYTPAGIMPKRAFGKTGMAVSMLGFGSHLREKLIADPDYRDRMIKLGIEGGINVFDVYDHYDYNQFKPMGNSLRDVRQDVLVSLCFVKSTELMQEEIDGALKDFHTDYIDLYRTYTTDDDRVNIMEKNKKAGKIRVIGFVSHDVATMSDYLDRYGDVADYAMIVYNFHHNKGAFGDSYPENDYAALIPRMKRMNLGVIGIKPMGSDAMVELARKEKFFGDKKANIAQAMLRHIYQSEDIHTTMPAMNTLGEVAINLESAYNPAISHYEKTKLNELSTMAKSTKSAYLPSHYKWLERWA
ncbi:aldo/keto reductase [Candidatus Latescibacterota bacterium]